SPSPTASGFFSAWAQSPSGERSSLRSQAFPCTGVRCIGADVAYWWSPHEASSHCRPPDRHPDSGRDGRAGRTAAGPQADRSAASVLLPRDVSAAAHERTELARLVAELA